VANSASTFYYACFQRNRFAAMGWYSDSDDDDRTLTDSLVIQLLGEEGKVLGLQSSFSWAIYMQALNFCSSLCKLA
jgi:hypothetical protein